MMLKLDNMDLQKKKILYVEGYSDENVVKELLAIHNVDSHSVEIQPCGGYKNAMIGFCQALNHMSNYASIGLLIDADDDMNSRYDEVNTYLADHMMSPIELPSLPNTGLIYEHNKTKIGIWLMPNCKGKGALESFLYNKITQDNSLLKEVENAVKQLEANSKNDTALKHHMFLNKHKKKAILRTYMAWKNPPDLSLGTAVKASFFSKETDEERIFIKWLKKLFCL